MPSPDTGNRSGPPSASPTPDLMSSMIIILISGAITIFVFWIATQFLGSDVFAKLPDFITDTYKGIWTSVITGATGIGLAILKAFADRAAPQPNYLKLIGISTGAFSILISIIVVISDFMGPRGELRVPSGAAIIDIADESEKPFDLENPSLGVGQLLVTYVLRGTYRLTKHAVIGHLKSGRMSFAKDLPHAFPSGITRTSFRVCYIQATHGTEQMYVYPETSKSRDSLDVNAPIAPGAEVILPQGDFTFELPGNTNLRRAWLCAAVWNDAGGYFPAQSRRQREQCWAAQVQVTDRS